MRRDLAAALVAAGEENTDGPLERLLIHLRLLASWNRRFKLTSLTTWPEVLDRHIRESLLPLQWIGRAGRLVDVGSGNGFPGIPILACRPDVRGLLVERSEKKGLFLEAVIRETRLTAVTVRSEDIRPGRPRGARSPAGKHGRSGGAGHRSESGERHSGIEESSPGDRSPAPDSRSYERAVVPPSATTARAVAGGEVSRPTLAGGIEDRGERFDYVVSRATLSPRDYLTLAVSCLAPAGRVFLFGGGEAEETAPSLGISLGLRLIAHQPISGRRRSSLLVFES